jgi:restriction system protein
MSEASSERTEFVYLHALDGFEFEKLCATIFEKLSYGRVEDVPDTGDEGRDLIIHTTDCTKIVVECKHHYNGTIGRPVVQKLHSAAHTEGAAKGILITTGKFSAEAITHARKVRPPIELIDLNLLRDLAERAGIHLATLEHEVPVGYYPISTDQNVAALFRSNFSKNIVSHPIPASGILELCKSHLRLWPAYRLRYGVHHDFHTSVGKIHSIQLDNLELLIDGANGQTVESGVTQFLSNTPTLTEEKVSEHMNKAERGQFALDQTTLARIAKEAIADLHTKVVSYYGRNNVRYTATCRPGERSIRIEDVAQTFIPEWFVSFLILSKQYSFHLIEKRNDIYDLGHQLSCRVCQETIRDSMLLCNSCGNIVHNTRNEGYRCKTCSKSICRHCTHWTRRWLILKSYFCEECAKSIESAKGKKLKPLTPDTPQKHCINCGAKMAVDAVKCLKCGGLQ